METLKQEEIDGRAYCDDDEARRMIGRFIEEIYNRQRLPSALAYRPPAQVWRLIILAVFFMKLNSTSPVAVTPAQAGLSDQPARGATAYSSSQRLF